jgi:4-hydroxy-tetrahydrodipicolinate synthase
MRALPDTFLKGSYCPIVTPFRVDGAVDHESYARLVDFQVAEGSHGIVVNGTSAEPSTMTTEERKALLETALRVAAGRVPVVAATGSQSLAETAELTLHAAAAGADALLVVTPYYVRPPQRGLIDYYREVGALSDLPLLIYHIPGRAAVAVTIETLGTIAQALPNFVGMKHASNDLTLLSEARILLGPEFRMFVGLEELSLPMMAIGACGMVNAVSNVSPRRVADLYEAIAAGDLAHGRDIHFDLFELNQAVFFDTNPIPIKYMMRKLGILTSNHHRLPMCAATPELEARLDGVLARARLDMSASAQA